MKEIENKRDMSPKIENWGPILAQECPQASSIQSSTSSLEDPTVFHRKITAEQIYIARPMNYAIMVAKIRGNLSEPSLRAALDRLTPYQPLLRSRVVYEKDGTAFFTSRNTPAPEISVLKKASESDWQGVVQQQHMQFFDVLRGPLIRFCLLCDEETTDMVVCAHHSICDGLSLTYLIRDILRLIADPKLALDKRRPPPPIEESIMPYRLGTPFLRGLISFINKRWKRKRVQFSSGDFKNLHAKFWERYGGCGIVSWMLDAVSVEKLLTKARNHQTTIHTILMTAFLRAQHLVQHESAPYFNKFHMPINMRNKFRVRLDDELGFFAASIVPKNVISLKQPFWEDVKKIGREIRQKMSNKALYRLYTLSLLHPNLVDAIYFEALGLIHQKWAKVIAGKMGVPRKMAGLSITNLGRVNIPTDYGDLKIYELYGPSVFSEILEKIVSACTLNGTLFFTITFTTSAINRDVILQVQQKTMEILRVIIEDC